MWASAGRRATAAASAFERWPFERRRAIELTPLGAGAAATHMLCIDHRKSVHVTNISEAAASQAALAILARLLEQLRDQKVLSPAQLADVLNKAIADSQHHPEWAGIAAAIHAIAGTTPPGA